MLLRAMPLHPSVAILQMILNCQASYRILHGLSRLLPATGCNSGEKQGIDRIGELHSGKTAVQTDRNETRQTGNGLAENRKVPLEREKSCLQTAKADGD